MIKFKLLKSFIILLIISLFFNVFMFDKIVVASAESSAEIVIDCESGRVFYSKNANEKRAMASLTKIVTCLTVLNNFPLDSKLKIKKEWTGIEGSSVYLKEGEVLTVKELLYCLMLRSGNDSAVALSRGLTANEDEFYALMHQTAAEAGATNSGFKNAHGLDEEGHYTTAYDLAMITRQAMQNPIFREIVATKRITVGQDDNRRLLINKNKLLSNYEYAIGVKTGYTKKAGRCLVSASNKDDFTLISVVLNCGPMYERSQALLDKVYSEYDRVLLADKEQAVGCLELKNGNKIPVYTGEDVYYPLTLQEQKSINCILNGNLTDSATVRFGEECGTIEFYLEKQLLFCKKIYTIKG